MLATFAAQLALPTGRMGQVVGRVLNRANGPLVAATVDAVAAEEGHICADIGFGGGVGLDLLLRRVGASGRVHGIEIAPTMLADARRRFAKDLDLGRLVLHDAAMDQLPLADGSLDRLITTNTVYFIEDLAPAFAELARVLRPSGRAAIGLGDPSAMGKMPFTKHGFRLRSVAEVTAQLESAGLHVTEDRRVGNSINAFHILVCQRSDTSSASRATDSAIQTAPSDSPAKP
ncbi:methyltransferase domain-containing protein [Antrihabitans stalactiti]